MALRVKGGNKMTMLTIDKVWKRFPEDVYGAFVHPAPDPGRPPV